MAAVSATYFTDPLCPWCWAAEPALRRLLAEFGDGVQVTFVLAGLARQVDAEQASTLALATLDACEASGQPADPRVWLRDPPSSSYPAGIAAHAVAEQGDPSGFLRRVREAVLLERRRMDTADALLEAARDAGGLDLDRLRIDFGSHAMLERFGADLERARSVEEPHRDPEKGRVALPTVAFRGADGGVHWAAGTWRWEDWRAAAIAAGARPAAALPGAEDAVRRFGAMTAADVAVVCDLPGPRAQAELWRLALDWRLQPRRVLGGDLWSAGP